MMMHSLTVRAIAWTGMVLLAAAAALPWLEVPASIREGTDGSQRCVTARPWAAAPYRLVSLAAAGVLATRAAALRPRSSRRAAVTAARLLAGLGFFPFFVMAYDPAVAARASLLHGEHLRLSSLAGDVSSAQEFSGLTQRDRIYLEDTVQDTAVLRLPSWSPGALQIGQLPVLVEASGYSDRFCQFIRPGWFAALAGASGILFSSVAAGGVLRPRRVLAAVRAGLTMATVGVVLGAGALLATAWQLDRARDATAFGNDQDACRYLEAAATILPALREDTFYVAQLGLLHWRLGRDDSPYARLARAGLLERDGLGAQALEIDHDLLATEPAGSAIGREAGRAVLRAGINALNSGRIQSAIALLETTIAHEPCDLKANLGLQLAYLRAGRWRDVGRMVRRIEAVYARFQFPTKAVVLSFSHENARLAAFEAGDLETALVEGYKAKHPLD
jgi:hypothetical protein